MVKLRISFSVLFIQLLIVSCQPISIDTPIIVDPQSPKSHLEETSPSEPTSINTKTPTPMTTVTPYPTLVNQGPYLLYDRSGGYGPLVLMNAGFRSRKILELPEGVYVNDLKHAVSPDGRWLVFYTGTYDEPYDLTMNLLAIPDGSIHPISRLLSSDYPSTFNIIADFYVQQGYDDFGLEDSSRMAFNYAITRVFEWSPDGRYLAFASQLDGPSSDLYVYDVQTSTTRRLTDDLRILSEVTWSPDGKWLLFENAIPGMTYTGATLHRIEADSSIVYNPPILEEGFWWSGIGWISTNHYLITGFGEGTDPYDLRFIDVRTGKMRSVWPEVYFSYAINSQDQIFAINGSVGISPDENRHIDETYLISFDGKTKLLVEDVNWIIGYQGGSQPHFVGLDNGEKVKILNDGTLIKSDLEIPTHSGLLPVFSNMLVSPDEQWSIIYEESYGRVPLTLFSESGDFVRTLSDLEVRSAIWRNDSSGIIFASNVELFFIAIPDGEPEMIDQCATKEDRCSFYSSSFVWLP